MEKGANMKVNYNPIPNYNSSTKSTNSLQHEQITTGELSERKAPLLSHANFPNINFKGEKAELVQPSFENPEMQKLFDKISYWVHKLPENSKTEKPIKMAFGEGTCEININKKTKNKTFLTIVATFPPNGLGILGRDKEEKEVLTIVLNQNSQMSSGTYTNGLQYINFERTNKNVRRIREFDKYSNSSVLYRPNGNNTKYWTTGVGIKTFEADQENVFSSEYVNSLGLLFLQLTGLKSKI